MLFFVCVVLETFYNLSEGLALVKDFMLSENSAVNLLWNYHEPVSCFLFEMSYYELITLMVNRKRNYDYYFRGYCDWKHQC